MFAKFEVRRLELPAARKILGTAIGMCPKEALFKGYIDLEVEVDIFYFFFFHFAHSNSMTATRIRSRTNIIREVPRGKILFGMKSSKLTHYAYISVRPVKFTCMDQIRRARVSAPRLRSHSRHI